MKKFAEVELQLKQLQENVEIPETDLLIHPIIKRAVETVSGQYETSPIRSNTGICRQMRRIRGQRSHPSRSNILATLPSSTLFKVMSIYGSSLFKP